MTRVLYIKASPRGGLSQSAAIASVFLEELRLRDAGVAVDELDLSREILPEFDGDRAEAKMALILGRNQSGHERTAWDAVVETVERFRRADVYVLAVPMWNGGIPYRLKQYIDLIHQPGLLFKLDPSTGYRGLLEGKKAVLCLTSGAYGPSRPSPAFGADHHGAYLRFWLNQAGVTDQREIRFQPTIVTPDPAGDFERAKEDARQLARRW